MPQDTKKIKRTTLYREFTKIKTETMDVCLGNLMRLQCLTNLLISSNVYLNAAPAIMIDNESLLLTPFGMSFMKACSSV